MHPLSGFRQNTATTFGTENTDWCGCLTVKSLIRLAVLTILACDIASWSSTELLHWNKLAPLNAEQSLQALLIEGIHFPRIIFGGCPTFQAMKEDL